VTSTVCAHEAGFPAFSGFFLHNKGFMTAILSECLTL
jgi:hypothetical protein